MRITDEAIAAVTRVMTKMGLSPATTFLELRQVQDGIGLGFTRDRFGKLLHFGPLGVVVAGNIDTTGVVVDYVERDGRRGIIFTGEKDDGQPEPAGSGPDHTEPTGDAPGGR
jgi:hypothetical protein